MAPQQNWAVAPASCPVHVAPRVQSLLQMETVGAPSPQCFLPVSEVQGVLVSQPWTLLGLAIRQPSSCVCEGSTCPTCPPTLLPPPSSFLLPLRLLLLGTGFELRALYL